MRRVGSANKRSWSLGSCCGRVALLVCWREAIERGLQSGRGTRLAHSMLHSVIALQVVHTVQSATMGAASEYAERGGACICSISQMQH